MGCYSAVWQLVDKPIADFQIGLASAWITPDNSDNKDKPLAPEGTVARNWKEPGPTWASVFQTVEGGLGYWAGNHFRYGPPKFSMNATPQCYDYEVGSPGWSFFSDDKALPDNRLGIAQLSNRLLIPPDALPFQGNPNGQFLGYAYMALPFTEPTTGDPPTGDQAWTCFLTPPISRGPSPITSPRPGARSARSLIIHSSTVVGWIRPRRHGRRRDGDQHRAAFRFGRRKRRRLHQDSPVAVPCRPAGRSLLVQDVTYYSKAALYDAFKAWRDGGPACSGRLNEKGAWRSKLSTHTTRYDQAGKPLTGVERVFDTKVFEGNVWGLEWREATSAPAAHFRSTTNTLATSASPSRPGRFPRRQGSMTRNSSCRARARPTHRR